jgi:thiamine-phosphate diphosphorylase/hydroxyethylthiazole kinase
MSSFRTTVDYSLYYVTGRFALPEGMDYYESLERACQGGVGIVQIREKNLSTREFLEIGRRSKIITDKVSADSYRQPSKQLNGSSISF